MKSKDFDLNFNDLKAPKEMRRITEKINDIRIIIKR